MRRNISLKDFINETIKKFPLYMKLFKRRMERDRILSNWFDKNLKTIEISGEKYCIYCGKNIQFHEKECKPFDGERNCIMINK